VAVVDVFKVCFDAVRYRKLEELARSCLSPMDLGKISEQLPFQFQCSFSPLNNNTNNISFEFRIAPGMIYSTGTRPDQTWFEVVRPSEFMNGRVFPFHNDSIWICPYHDYWTSTHYPDIVPEMQDSFRPSSNGSKSDSLTGGAFKRKKDCQPERRPSLQPRPRKRPCVKQNNSPLFCFLFYFFSISLPAKQDCQKNRTPGEGFEPPSSTLSLLRKTSRSVIICQQLAAVPGIRRPYILTN